MTLIVAEGVDGSGKSTLIAELSHLAGNETRVKHRGPLKTHPLLEYVYDLIAYQPDRDTILCDRWHVGELVYGPLYRSKSELTPAMTRYVEMFLASRGALRLMMSTPYEVVQHRITERGEDFLQPEHLHLVHDFYSEYARKEGWGEVKASYDTGDLRRVLKDAKVMARVAARIARFPGYVGPVAPRTLLLTSGNVLNSAERGFIASNPPYNPSFGHILLTALEQAEVRPTYGMASVTEPGLAELHAALGKPPIVALGPAAANLARTSHGVTVNSTQRSPIDYRDFPHSELVRYGLELKGVIRA